MQKEYDLIVVGGGITGLASAYLAAKDGKKVAVIEAGKNFGGLLSTFDIGGNKLEYYYHHFFMHDAELNWLIQDLGIADKLFFKKTTMGVYRDGKIYDFNSGLDLLKFKPINWIDKFRFGLSSIYLGKFAKWEKLENVSALSWFRKWAGKSTTSSLWEPMLRIKFDPYAEKVPLAWMVGRLRQRLGSRKGGDERLGYLTGSLKTLLDTILGKLTEMGVDLIAEAPIDNITISENKISSVHSKEKAFVAKNFLMTIPSNRLSDLLRTQMKDYSEKLDQVKYFGAMCTILEMKKPLSEIYWLNVAAEGFPFGGVIEHTNFIPAKEYNGSHIAYLSRYFAHEEDVASMNQEEIKKLMLAKLPEIYPDFKQEDLKEVYLFKTMTAATVCDMNFSEKISDCKSPIDNMYLANMSHVYPDERSTNNSIRVAAEACKAMGIDTNYVPENASLAGKIGFKK